MDLVSMMFWFVTLKSSAFNGQWCGLGPLLNQICSKSYKFVLVGVPIWCGCPLKVQSWKLRKQWYIVASVYQKYPENFAFQLFIILQ